MLAFSSVYKRPWGSIHTGRYASLIAQHRFSAAMAATNTNLHVLASQH